MSLKSKHVKVVIRTRPTAAFAQDILQFGSDKKSIHIHIPKGEEGGYINNQQEDWDFRFDNILHNASQETVYEECGLPIIKGLLDGYNGTILAYGQTGAGKTFTMTGASENFKHRGLIPRAISQLFKEIADRPQLSYTVRISFLEIYKESMIDLLSSIGESSNSDGSLTVVEEKNGSTHVKGLTTQLVANEEEALNLLFEGEMNRSISEHQLNKNSSRSHCIFTLHVESRSRVESSEKVLFSKLNLVDLAGSERLSKTETSGVSLKEAMYINRSLTYLEQVIIALADKKRDHVPYRQSKMTHVLRDALGGNCNTLMIANIWGEKCHIEETISTLRFAKRMMCVTNNPEVNVQYDPLALIKKYEREIKDLKQELLMHDTLSNRSLIQYEPYSDVQRYELQKLVKSYLESENDDIEIVNLRQIKEIFYQFKVLYKTLEAEKEESLKLKPVQSNAAKKDSAKDDNSGQKLSDNLDFEDGVGETDGTGFGIGISPVKGGKTGANSTRKTLVGSKPGKTLAQVLATENKQDTVDEENVNEGQTVEGDSTRVGEATLTESGHQLFLPPNVRERRAGAAPLSRAEEFENFKKDRGYSMYRNLLDNKNILKEKRKSAKELAQLINDVKKDMDDIKGKLNEKKQSRVLLESKGIISEKTILDEHEYNMLNSIKSLGNQYKEHYEQLKGVRSEIEYCSHVVDQCRQKFMSEFEQWYESIYGGPVVENVNEGPEDVLDIGEKFDRLQMERMSQEDPDSLPYYNAKKNTERRSQKVIRKVIPRVATRAV